MSQSHEYQICMALYQNARAKGAPVVHVVDLGGGYMCAETADGKVLHEGVEACCKWAIKFELAQEWLSSVASPAMNQHMHSKL